MSDHEQEFNGLAEFEDRYLNVSGNRMRVTRLDSQGNPTGEPIEIQGSITGRLHKGEPEPQEIPPLRMPPFESIKMDVQFNEVDPDALALFTGTGKYTPGSRHSMLVTSPIKRTFWQWLRRRPRQYRSIYLPSVKIGEVSTDDNDPS